MILIELKKFLIRATLMIPVHFSCVNQTAGRYYLAMRLTLPLGSVYLPLNLPPPRPARQVTKE